MSSAAAESGERSRQKKEQEKGRGGGGLFIFKCVHEMTLLKKRSTGSQLMKLSDGGRGRKESPN